MTTHDALPFSAINDSDPISFDKSDTPRGYGKVEMTYGLPSHGTFRDDMLAVRQDFVVNVMKWYGKDHVEGNDQYDHDPRTMHIGIRDHDDESLIAGVRLSRPRSLNQVLSLTMLSNKALEAVSEEQIDGQPALEVLHDLADRGLLRDMTRLVADVSKDPHQIAPSMMELFGYAAAQVRAEIQRENTEDVTDVKWVFATTEEVKGALEYNGVQFHTLVCADFSENDASTSQASNENKLPSTKKPSKKSYLCIVDQESAIAHIESHSDTLGHSLTPLHNGLRKANAL